MKGNHILEKKMDKKVVGKENKKIDWKFTIGVAILLVVMVFLAGFFWTTVAKQAELVKQEEAAEEANAISAIYVQVGDLLKESYFVDMDTKTVFTADYPSEGIYNMKGRLVREDVLEIGDMVKIYGDGVMTRSIPAQYSGVTKMQRIGRASLEEVEEYKKIVEESFGHGVAE